MRFVSIGNNEFLIYNDQIAGFFCDFRSNANHAVHRIENRKLTDEEIQDLLESLLNIGEDIDLNTKEEDFRVLEHIATYYPEMRYFVHGIPTYHQAIAEETVKEQNDRLRQLQKEKDDARKERMNKEYEDAAKKRSQQQKKDSQVKLGKDGQEKFGGFKGLLFDMLKAFKDPKTKHEKERLKKELKEEWKRYKSNQKILDQNRELVDDMRIQLEKGKVTPESISLMNDLIAKDPFWVKQLDFDVDKPTLAIPLAKFADFLDIKEDIPLEALEKQIGKCFKDERLNDISFSMDKVKGAVNVTTNWNTATKLLDIFNIKAKDLLKPIS